MGILNVTPDSFSDGGQHAGRAEAVAVGLAMAHHADIVDVGGESTRPGAEPVSLEEELRRTVEVVRELAAAGVLVSIDTQKPEVADAACAAGAALINDVSGLSDPAMLEVAARRGVSVCAMHMQGTPRTMQLAPSYDDVVHEVSSALRDAKERALAAGIPAEQILVDPGIGFGKTLEHNLLLQRNIAALERATGAAVLVGPSRKAFIGTLTGQPLHGRDFGTAGAVAACAFLGARVLRVHSVAAMRDVLNVALGIYRIRGHQPT